MQVFTLDDYYNTIAESYDELHGKEQLEKIKIIHNLLNNDQILQLNINSIIFDLGCGTGLSLTGFPNIVFGLDPAMELLEIANSKRSNNKLIKKDSNNQPFQDHLGYILGIAEHLPIKNKSVDISISVTSIHNFNNIQQGLKELSRITKDRAVISILKKAKNFEVIIETIESEFYILQTAENNFDYFLYLEPKY
jgi:ubiquinone/menaquinone biosynthesis C-methylase UbiE